ncbi:MAG: YqgE/AlgH family protein, partial [Acidocella sp.]|nr:YqgE/AlgH family protein [Acidocella sp.]
MDTAETPTAHWLTGQLLVAMPAMRQTSFAQSVIFICAHTRDGAMGVVLNQPLRAPEFAPLLEQLGIQPCPPARALPLGTGGPVDDHRGFVLHSSDWSSDGSMVVDGNYLLTADLEILHAVASGGGPERAIM